MLPGLLWKGLPADGRMPGQGLGLAPMGQRIFRTVRRGGLPKLRSEFLVLWELPGARRVPSGQLEPFKNGRNSCRPKHTQENKPTIPSPVGFPEGRLGLSPALVPGQRKNQCLGLRPFCQGLEVRKGLEASCLSLFREAWWGLLLQVPSRTEALAP